MIAPTFDWFTIFIINICGNAALGLLITVFLYLIILILGKVSYQSIVVLLLAPITYFSSILFSGKATMLIMLSLAIINLVFQWNRTEGREQ